MRRVGAAIALTLAVMVLIGCDEEPANAPTTEKFAEQREALKQKKLAQKKKASAEAGKAKATAPAASDAGTKVAYAGAHADYVYDAEGKRDPFRSFQWVDEELPEQGFGPLGDYELGQLSVLAVVWDTNRPRAMVADPGGRSFIVAEGSQIGKNNGRVIHIGDDLVLVKETYVDFEGNQSTKDVEMRIRRSQGG